MEALPDFVKLAEAYGHVGMRITDLKDLKPMMEEAFAMKDRLVFLDIAVDNTEHVYPMQIRDGAMRDMWLRLKTERTDHEPHHFPADGKRAGRAVPCRRSVLPAQLQHRKPDRGRHHRKITVSAITIVTTGRRRSSTRSRRSWTGWCRCTESPITTAGPHVERELALIKVTGTGEKRVEGAAAGRYFRARPVDTTTRASIFEIAGPPDKVDGFIALMRELGLVEVGRTGVVGMLRGPQGA